MKLLWGVAMLVAGLFWSPSGAQALEVVKLPAPAFKGAISVEEALKQRRTVRRFASRGLDLKQVGQILWAADGLSDPRGYRTAASAGATFPMEIYLVVGERGVAGLAAGVYRYRPEDHSLGLVSKGEARHAVARASLHQTWMAEALVMVVIAAEYGRCTARYGQRGVMYTHIEAGHVGTNVFLQAEALGLGAGIVGAFDDKGLAQALKLPGHHEPLLVMPVGYKY
jgi:SagB-type dehydrogenase family enzyme